MLLKKYVFFLIILLSVCFWSYFQTIQAYYESVENVFLDIDSDYKYLQELQNLYDKWVITPDENGKFNPTKLLNRDEFVGIVMEVSCKDCIKPDTALEYISQYTGKTIFYDLKESNKFFYCIADAEKNDVVKWYWESYTCEDKTFQAGKNPFCTNNNITLEEALAVLLRNSSVFTIADNNSVIAQIAAGSITQDLAKDVKTKTIEGDIYTFYGYFKKALELKYEEYDVYGNLKKYQLVSADSNGNLNPKKYVSKEEFLRMSYIISKINSCSLLNDNNNKNSSIAWKIDIFDKSCTGDTKNCKKSDLNDETGTYDFSADISTTCEKGIKNYTRILYNKNDGTFIVESGKLLDNYKFKSYWIWQIRLIVEDNCWNQIDLRNQISYLDPTTKKSSDNDLGVSIIAQPITGFWPLKVDLESIVSNCPNCKYEWSFWDGNTSTLKDPSHTFVESGVYDVKLIIVDSDGNKAFANVVIVVKKDLQDINNMIDDIASKYKVDLWDIKKNINDGNLDDAIKGIELVEWANKWNTWLINDLDNLWDAISNSTLVEKIDSDKDGVYDDEDKCVNVKWLASNKWCPNLEQECLANSEKNTCKTGYVCGAQWFCVIDTKTTADIAWSCIYPSNGSSIFWNAVCDSCPCDFSFDFKAKIRRCDIIVPAITSPDKKEIYGRGEPYQVPYNYE